MLPNILAKQNRANRPTLFAKTLAKQQLLSLLFDNITLDNLTIIKILSGGDVQLKNVPLRHDCFNNMFLTVQF